MYSMNKIKLTIIIEEDEDCYVASVPELRGCHTQGETIMELMDNINEAMKLWIEVFQEKQGDNWKLYIQNQQ